MTTERVERRLAAVLAADVAGYSRLMGTDEVGTLQALKAHRREVVDPAIAAHKGRIVKTTGDGLLVEFASAVDAVTCALSVQEKMAERNASLTSAITFRIGINVGDIIIDGDDIFGDGVNIAARVENECQPGGVCLSGNAFEQVRGKTTFAFDDLGERALKNIDRPVRLYSAQTAATPAASVKPQAEARTPLALPDRPSIAVLPFQNMSGDPEQEYFADGMVEDIITALSRFKLLFVIARNSSFTYKGSAVDVKKVGRELGVHYVLEGSVRKASGRVRITGQLIEAATDKHLWADRFDGNLDDVFDLQDKITESVVGAIAPKLEQAEIERAKRKPTERLDSYDLFLRGMALMYQRSIPEAGVSFQEAFARDPDYAAAYAMAAIALIVPLNFTGAPVPEEIRVNAVQWANRAVRVGEDDALALARSAQILAFNAGEYEQADALIEQAAILNPNHAVVWFAGGFVSINCGDWDRALQRFSRVLKLSPLDPVRPNVWYGMAFAYAALGRYDEGYAMAKKAVQTWPHVHSLGSLIFCAICTDRLGEASEALQRLLKLQPNFKHAHVNEVFHTRDLEMRDAVAEAFRRAGLE